MKLHFMASDGVGTRSNVESNRIVESIVKRLRTSPRRTALIVSGDKTSRSEGSLLRSVIISHWQVSNLTYEAKEAAIQRCIQLQPPSMLSNYHSNREQSRLWSVKK